MGGSLPTNIHEKKDWNTKTGASHRQLMELTNQYPWEEGLKHHWCQWGRIDIDTLTNQYPWEEGLKLQTDSGITPSKITYQPISMRRRIETRSFSSCFLSPLPLPTNIHEKKDWNFAAMKKKRQRHNAYQPISMRRRIETREAKGLRPGQQNLTNQYPWEEGLKPQN